MPEGHLLHRIAGQQSELVGRRLCVSSPQGRFAAGAAALDGRVLEGVEGYGKHLLHRFDGGVHLHTHLGLAGTWARLAPPSPGRPQVRARLATDDVAWDLFAPAACEVLDEVAVAALVDRLGPDPLRPDADPGEAEARLRSRRVPVGAALLDQSVIAGVGNVLRAEALAACRLHPERPSTSITTEEFRCLWASLQRMMRRGVEDGRLITIDEDDAMARASLPESEGRLVYKQERCRRCGTAVESWPQAGRTAYACPRCQPAP